MNLQERIWPFELHNCALGGLIPDGFKLRLLTEDLQAFENNEVVAETAQEQLFLKIVSCSRNRVIMGNRTTYGQL
jgi:hypothetical protein